MPLTALPTSTGARIAVLDALAQADLELVVGDLLAFEVLGQDVVVGLGGGLEQLVAPAGDLGGQSSGIGISTSLEPSHWYALRWTRST